MSQHFLWVISMKLYHSHAGRTLYHLHDVPDVSPLSLTLDSTVRDACCAFIHHDMRLQAAREAGKARGHEPYCAIANGEHGFVLLRDFTRRYANLLVTSLYGRKLAAGTVNGIASKFRRLFAWLYALEVVNANPFDGILRAPATPRRRATRSLTADEIAAVLGHLDAVQSRVVPAGTYGDMFRLGLLTAMRYNELLQLTPSMLQLDADIPHALVSEQYAKTRTAREVVLSPAAVRILRSYCAGKGSNERLFPCSYSSLQERLNDCSAKLGVPVFFHLTRHTAICEYAASAQSMSELQAFSGHASKQGVEPYANHDMQALRQRVLARLSGEAARGTERTDA